MYSDATRQRALGLAAAGISDGEVSRTLSVSRSTVRRWRLHPERTPPRGECPMCESAPLDTVAYSALLGFYLGDGHISQAPRFHALRITCDQRYEGIILDVERLLQKVRPGMRTFRIPLKGAVNIQAHWKHWPCLFPQHGPGRKHERRIVLEDWQRRIIEAHPEAFLRGLLHSDGCRARNWTQRTVAGQCKRYEYPRWQFTNNSADIRGLCCWALDLVSIDWRQSNWKTISVSRRSGVARLDELIGLKS